MTLRIAMWSGPRNISTAMMRAWENRPDCVVVDEPFYTCYLHATGIEHPMTEEVIASQSTDWDTVAKSLTTEPCNAEVFYQKHMTHHMIPDVDLSWTSELQHCFLVRNPYEVVNSYAQKRDSINTDDIGIIRQLELYDEISSISGEGIPVIDAKEVLLDPKTTLIKLCSQLGIPFLDAMLSWPPGRRDSDGVWAPHWYHAVEESTGFEPYRERELNITDEQREVASLSEEAYLTLIERGKGC